MINQREASNLGLFDDLYSKQVVLQRINHNHYISKLRVDNAVSVISVMLRPHNVNLVVTKVTHLQKEQSIVYMTDLSMGDSTTTKNNFKPEGMMSKIKFYKIPRSKLPTVSYCLR